jgi:hypothetical protein
MRKSRAKIPTPKFLARSPPVKSPNPILPIALTLCCTLLPPTHAAAQQDAPLQQELQHLGIAAAALDHSLPSFTCQETVISQVLHRKKVEQQTSFTAILRVKRAAADGTLSESYTLTTLNGRPFSGGGFNIPVYVEGGFRRAMIYFLPSLQACYRYQLSSGRIDFETAPAIASPSLCQNEGMSGFAQLDAAGNVTHLERQVSPQGAKDLRLAPFAAFDFTDVALGGRTYRLSHHLLSEIPSGRFTGRFDATYTDCHLFTATVTLGPATEVPPSDTPQPQ